MKKFLIQSILLITAIAVGIIFFVPGRSTQQLSIPFLPQTTVTKKLQINNNTLNVEIADTIQKRNKGLGGRQSLASDSGMLFIFDKADTYPFWMKGLIFPLDFIWLREKKVVDLSSNIPAPVPGQKDETLPLISSKVPVDQVLEVNAGTIDRLGIKVGDSIQLE